MKTTTKSQPATKAKTQPSKVKKPLTAAELMEARDGLHNIKQQIEVLREKELATREWIADRLHDGTEGSKTVTIDGVKVTITRNLNRSISEEEAVRLKQTYPKLWATCLSFKPTVRVGESKKNPEMEDFIVTRPGPPTVVFA